MHANLLQPSHVLPSQYFPVNQYEINHEYPCSPSVLISVSNEACAVIMTLSLFIIPYPCVLVHGVISVDRFNVLANGDPLDHNYANDAAPKCKYNTHVDALIIIFVCS